MSNGEITLGQPLTRFLDTPGFDASPLGVVNAEHPDSWAIALTRDEQEATHAWRIVGCYFAEEDTTITRFQAVLNIGGQPVLIATDFGVVHGDMNPDQLRQLSGYKYYPFSQRKVYVPVDRQMVVNATGGYHIKVLDKKYPSEGISTGLAKAGPQHKTLVTTWELQELPNNYPQGDG